MSCRTAIRRQPEDLPPRHKHDCDHCVYLGRFEKSDLYVCVGESPKDYRTTVIARDGEDGSYNSGLCIIHMVKPLYVAAKRAINRGILDPTWPTGGAGQKDIAELVEKGDKKWNLEPTTLL